MTLAAEQRARLLRTKLAALARQLGLEGEPVDVATAAALAAPGGAAVLVADASAAALAGALLWSARQQAAPLTVLVDDGAAELARLAGYFCLGGADVAVREVQGAGSVPVAPAPLPQPVDVPEVSAALVDPMRRLGLEVVVEHGEVRGEVLGLEVARLVRWPSEIGGDDELHLEAGVGRFDRDAVAAARPDEAPEQSLRRTVEQVRAHRYPGAPVHPVQLLARERWLRSMVLAEPSLVGATRLEPVDMTTAPAGLKDAHPAAAAGTDAAGAPVVVVCSRGVDLSLVPLAADTRAMVDPDARLVLALPAQDHHVATSTLVELLRSPAELVELAPGWG